MFHRKRFGFTLGEIMIVVTLIGFLIAVAVPTFFRARESSRQRSCQTTLSQIDGAKERYALEENAGAGQVIEWSDLIGSARYLRAEPSCPGGGVYTLGAIGEEPACSLSDQQLYPHEFRPDPPDPNPGG